MFGSRSKLDINFWYGDRQEFGVPGRAQRWVNILGNVDRPELVEKLQYRVGVGDLRDLSMGPDLHRLAQTGDFNAEISWEELGNGPSRIQVIALMRNGAIRTAHVRLYVYPEFDWPLPVWIDFARKTGQREIQIVDGKWAETPAGLRTAEPYYDRVIAVGDSTWRDYEATARITVHGFTPSSEGPPTYGVTHMGMALRWRGHHPDGLQPSRQWYPLGAQGEFLLDADAEGGRWRILLDGRPGGTQPVYGERSKPYVAGKPMYIKGQVSTLADGRSRYRFKQWMEGESEPEVWDVEGYEEGENDYRSGALCLVPHNSDVTIHSIMVEPLQKAATGWLTRPGSGKLLFSAPAGSLYGARGGEFQEDFLCAGCRLLAVQVNMGEVLRGLRFRYAAGSNGEERELTIGHEEGNWLPWHTVPEAAVLTGISGASDWHIDRLRLHFSDGSSTPEYGGPGGDDRFSLSVPYGDGRPLRIRGIYGSSDGTGIEYLGFISDPVD